MRKIIFSLALSVTACLAQTIVPPIGVLPVRFPPQLQEYLALSDDQVNRILAAKSDFAIFQGSQASRQFQLQQEIAQETAKPVPDPLALGSRYAALESIRRDLLIHQQTLLAAIQAILSVNQRSKLATLQQALTLYSTACSAVEQGLLSPPASSAALILGVISLYPPSYPSCSAVLPTTVIRQGDFSFTP